MIYFLKNASSSDTEYLSEQKRRSGIGNNVFELTVVAFTVCGDL